MSTSLSQPQPLGHPWSRLGSYFVGLAPFIVIWIILVLWLSNLLYSRANWSDVSDQVLIQEWLDETKPFRKTLPELIQDYWVGLSTALPTDQQLKREEILEQLQAMTEPTRLYPNQLPGFPILFYIAIEFPVHPELGPIDPIVWENPLPRPRQQNQTQVRRFVYDPLRDPQAPIRVTVDYQLHVFTKLQERGLYRQRESWIAGAVLIAASLIAVLFVTRFLSRELKRETQRLQATADAEHRERELLQARLEQQQILQAKEELDRKFLEQKLEAATLEKRADQAEKTALTMRSQLHASIGIMAGSYAHNIKNLLVRPNDLLSRCIDVDGMSSEQQGMLQEVRGTLGTVTERLQLILKTVRRDPNEAQKTPIDLLALLRDTAKTWTDLASDKWKAHLHFDIPTEAVWVMGDLSHLQQAIENLIFNARDATFEMRNHIRELARQTETDHPHDRRQKLIEAASWKGEIRLQLRTTESHAILEIADNGIGMSEQVQERCLETRFSTKRDNAVFEGLAAGMGLGLSFVAMVFEHHQASLTIQSQPYHGAVFRIEFPRCSMPTHEGMTTN